MSLLLLFKGSVAAGTRTLTVVPDSLFPAVGDTATFTATLLDEDGLPLVAKTIYFDVTGANSASGSDTTDVNGEATFQYVVANAGLDTIRARWGKATGMNLVSIDTSTDRAYEHDGFSQTILSDFATPTSSPSYVTWDGDNLITTAGNTIYQHSGFTSTVQDSFVATGSVLGVAWDGTNLLAAIGSDIKKYVGFSSSVQQSITPAGISTIRGIGWDGENLLIADDVPLAASKVHRFVGFSTTLDSTLTMLDSNTISGVTWDGDNLVHGGEDTAGSGPDKIYKHSGYSATVTTTIDSPNSQIRGVGWTVAMTAETTVTASRRGLGVLGRRTARVVP